MQVHALRMSGEGEERRAGVRHLLVGGGPIQQPEVEWLGTLPVKPYVSYGMTETVSHVALSPLETGKEPLYQALPDVRFSIDERECLVIHADYLAGSPFVTNDVVRLHSDHSFSWLGRWDNVINTGGVKVFPEKMEKKIEQEDKKAHYLRREFNYTKFEQTLLLPDDVEKAKIAARVEHGVLTVTLPKTEQARTKVERQIEIG